MAKDIFDDKDYLELKEALKPEISLSPWGSLITEETREIEYLLKPVIFRGSRTLIYAASGIGKTYFGLGIGGALS